MGGIFLLVSLATAVGFPLLVLGIVLLCAIDESSKARQRRTTGSRAATKPPAELEAPEVHQAA